MSHLGLCPACGNELSDTKVCGSLVICDCGYSRSITNPHAPRRETKDRAVFTMIAICAFFVGSFIHAVNWDKYFFTIIPLKLKQVTSMANAEDYQQLIDICSQRAKSDCVENSYQSLYQIMPERVELLAELAHLQLLRTDFQKASNTLNLYFSKGGKSMDAAYDYARSLSKLGQYQQAITYFQSVLKAKPRVFQISVARAYIQTLMKSEKYSQAKSVIEYYRKNSVSSAFFMDPEYKEIQKLLRSSGRKVAKQS
ncbi:MAG: hypothetical protein KDD22_05150 [Bdellovibrionales bacterium]|nr:hypothetical protein [Bdellovibrionales bacterium]